MFLVHIFHYSVIWLAAYFFNLSMHRIVPQLFCGGSYFAGLCGQCSNSAGWKLERIKVRIAKDRKEIQELRDVSQSSTNTVITTIVLPVMQSNLSTIVLEKLIRQNKAGDTKQFRIYLNSPVLKAKCS